MTLTPGQVIDDKYRIVRLLGTGGMGAVFEGENTRIKRRVAIKVLHASVSGSGETVARFEREAQAAGRIGSEHICEVLDLGVLSDGARYMVMEYLDGETLSARIKRSGRLAPPQSIPIMAQVLDALAAAHAAGIIHRDLKPDNIFILPNKAGRADFVKILDFGVSKFSQLSGDGEEMNVTRAGSVVGTPYYMSPEQARGMAVVDARSDIYALGVVLYQATTGQVPFRAETFNELLFKIALELPPPPQQFVPDLDPEFCMIIQRAMAREQANRFQSCAEFKEALFAWQAARGGGPPMIVPGARPPTMPPGLLVAPGPMAHTPLPGMIPGVGMATPPPGVIPGMHVTGQTGHSLDGSQGTANAWGHTSGAAAPKPSRAGAVVGGLVGVVLIAGLGVAGYLMLGKKDSAQAGGSIPTATTSAAPPIATSVAAPVETPAATPPTAEPTASAIDLDDPTPPEATTTDPVASGAPTTSSAAPLGTPSTKLWGTLPKPSATATTKPNKGGTTGDFGY
ncbi:serine/threonine protein kinase [Polyangium spumosum]|uniref:non-specific serine/threonine protein kinase n=1 Tax=Polyangium spumosum TaxID=889282 RepID=A0A6N7PEV7_9BACT|nr:serine/threonine-protein kinase [Polyangium spumosum]MRG90509.1 protein kinase [Polyangium spumosum]